jgi:hypothetical protein
VIAALSSRGVQATPAVGFVGLTVVKGTFGDIDAFNHVVPPDFWKTWHNSDVWLSWQKTRATPTLHPEQHLAAWRHHRRHSHRGTADHHHQRNGDRLRAATATAGRTCQAPATFVDAGGTTCT